MNLQERIEQYLNKKLDKSVTFESSLNEEDYMSSKNMQNAFKINQLIKEKERELKELNPEGNNGIKKLSPTKKKRWVQLLQQIDDLKDKYQNAFK